MKRFILMSAFFLFQTATSQPLFKLEINHSFIWGYNRNYAEVWKFYYHEDEPSNQFNYGFIKVKNLRYKPYLSDNTKISFGYAFPWFKVWIGWHSYDSYNASMLQIESTETEMYYYRIWDSVLFPLLNTDYPQYASPQVLYSYQHLIRNVYSLTFEFSTFRAEFNYVLTNEEDGLRFDEIAKIYDYFYNYVTIRDLSQTKRRFYILDLTYSPQISLLKHLSFHPQLGFGVGYEKSNISNEFIDTDAGYFVSKFDNQRTPFYYEGIVAQKLTLKNLLFYLKLAPTLKFKLDKNVYVGTGFLLQFYPRYITRYELVFPWGVGLDTNAKTGMKWEKQFNSVVVIHFNLFFVETKF